MTDPFGTRSREFYLRYGVSPDRLVPSPHSVDNNFFFSQASQLSHQKRKIRESIGVTAGTPVILNVSKMIPRKRPMDLLEAFEKLATQAVLVLVGDGPLRSEVENYVAEHSLTNVFCAGFQSQHDLSKYYAIADVFVLPSEYEPWGLVVNEAMCFSLPIVTTRGVSSSADLVMHGKNGFLYNAGDLKALHVALRGLIGDAKQRLEMGQRSRRIIERWGQNDSVDGICRGISMALMK